MSAQSGAPVLEGNSWRLALLDHLSVGRSLYYVTLLYRFSVHMPPAALLKLVLHLSVLLPMQRLQSASITAFLAYLSYT